MKPEPTTSFEAWLEALRARIDSRLRQLITSHSQPPSRLAEAIEYSTVLGGKRVRPALVIAAAHSFGASEEQALLPACAVELLHTYSLVHDDLPAMDDDDLRRGQASCHKAFDEATAILAGDALQTMAFELLSKPDAELSSAQQIAMINTLARASGARGMVLGQALDLQAEGKQLDAEALANIHRHKTGALIEACVQMGALSGPLTPNEGEQQALRRYARSIGLAFQVQDDILDVIGDTRTLGKQQGADAARGKSTYPALLGLDGARNKLSELLTEAHEALNSLADRDTSQLAAIADFIVSRVR